MDALEIKSFKIDIAEERLAAINAKVQAYDWNQLPDVGGWDGGVGIADLKKLVGYWQRSFNWRDTEARLNQLPHFVTDIDNEKIHFLHFKGDGSKTPVLLLHGWPGSFLEFGSIPQKLSAEGHDVIVPSLPGFAFSNPITGVIGPRRAAELMATLMNGLFGDNGYVVQGGDWGAHIANWMAYFKPAGLLGIHINMASIYAKDAIALTQKEKDLLERRSEILDWETGYNHEQETRPQTLGVAMADSPVGLAGWILEKVGKWSDLPQRPDGSPDIWSKYTEQQLLENIMLYIVNGAEVTSTWIYLGKRLEGSSQFPAGTYIDMPTGVAAFPDPVFIPTPRSFLQRTYNIIHWSEMQSGGHFAAMEEPDLLLNDLLEFISILSKVSK